MKRTDSMWAVAILSKRSEWIRDETLARTRKAAWRKMLDLYGEAFRDSAVGDPSKRDGWMKFHKDRDSGRIRAVRVDVAWEATR